LYFSWQAIFALAKTMTDVQFIATVEELLAILNDSIQPMARVSAVQTAN
jgi:hypothetical protein